MSSKINQAIQYIQLTPMQGLPLIVEIEMLKETVQRKELSTSTEVEGEGEEEKMMTRADPGAVRQDTKEVD